MLGVSYEECIVFEDAFSGIEAAKNAGMIAFGLGEASKSNLADFKADNMDDAVIIKEFKTLCGF